MRPKLLKMKAFGPYGGTEVIDFGMLEDTNMFLIHGPTGAGKTTILDAICYALYGYTNGGERTAESMRSKFAEEDEAAEVELIFTIREDEYKITRSPRFERPKKRGTGTTVEEVKAVLYKKEGDDYILVAAKPQEVDRKIQELLTFNIDQFRQVIMIAQNKFRELLTAPSKERQKILQDIFETGIYQSVEKQLELLNSTLTSKVRDKELTYQGILEHIEHEGHDILNQYIQTKLIGNAKEVIQLLDEMITSKKETVHSHRQQLDALTEKLKKLQEALIKETEKNNQYTKKKNSEEALQKLIQEAPYYESLQIKLEKASKLRGIVHLEETIKAIEVTLKSLKEEISSHLVHKKQLEASIQELHTQNEVLGKEKDPIESIRKECQLLESYRPRIEVLEKDKKLKEACENQIALCMKNYTQLEATAKALMATIQAKEEELQLKESFTKALTDNQLILQKVQIILERKGEIQAKEKEIQGTRQSFVTIRDQIAALTQQEKLIHEAYESLFAGWMKSQAGELAKNLEENMPCPVCGATNHPQKAIQTEEMITLDQIKAKEQERLALNGKISKLKEEQTKYLEYGMKLKTDIEQMQVKMQEMMANSEEVDSNFQESLMQRIEEQKAQVAHMAKVELALREQKITLEQLSEKLMSTREEKATLDLQLTEVKTKIQAVREELPEAFHDIEALKSRILANQKAIVAYEAKQKELTEAIEKGKIAYTRCETMVEEKTEQMKKQQETYEKSHDTFNKEREVLGVEEEGVYEELKTMLKEQEAYTRKVQGYHTQKTVLETTLKELCKDLEDFQVGKLGEIQEAFEKSSEEKEARQLEQAMLTKQITTYQKQIEELENLYTLNEALVKKQKIVGMMSSLAKGKNGKGLSFERYIQSSIFDEVLESANQKLRPMTSSRYELFRTDAMKRKNAQSGLDIAVVDHYVGEMRPVNTLSGGESFMAALALALGLADVISRLAGAANLDTMFIDEGFGTLDEEALEMAIKVLLGLQDTGRLVGIISHVRELREQIPAKLEIISTKEGSHTRFRV